MDAIDLEPFEGAGRKVPAESLRLPVAVIKTEHHRAITLVPHTSQLTDRHAVYGCLVSLQHINYSTVNNAHSTVLILPSVWR